MPQQENGYDCGVFVMLFFEAFLNREVSPWWARAAIESFDVFSPFSFINLFYFLLFIFDLISVLFCFSLFFSRNG